MQDGAVGISTSLQYAPAPYAKTEELIALASEAANSAASTPRTCAAKATAITGAIDEAVRIGREAHIPVEIWHLKAAGKKQLGADAADRRADRKGARIGRGYQRQHLRLSGLVQHVFGFHPALGA